MWLWWIVSILVLAGSVMFSLYIFLGGYKISPVKKEVFLEKPYTKRPYPFSKGQVIASLKLKLQAVENNALFYSSELKKLQQRIQLLEKGKGAKVYDNENWEELYYNLHDEKEKLENELDFANQALLNAQHKVNQLEAKERDWKETQSELEAQLDKAHILQNEIGELQRVLEGAGEREKELELELEAYKNIKSDFELLQQEYAHIQSEADELRNRIQDINKRDVLLQQKINRLTELESTIEISEYEKMDIRKSLEEIITENEALAAKLQELQEKLHAERYV